MVRNITEEVKLWRGRALAMSLALDEGMGDNNNNNSISEPRSNSYNGNELIIKVMTKNNE